MDRSRVLRVLRSSELFQSVSDRDLERLLDAGQLRSVSARRPLFDQMDSDAALLVVLWGSVQVEGTSPEGNALVHRRIGVGEILGEISLLDGEPRTAAAVAHEDCGVLWIERAPALAFLEAQPRVALALATLLARRIRTTSWLLEDAIFLGARERVGNMVVELARTLGRPAPGGGVRIDATHEQIGQRSGLHRVSVSNQLKQLEVEGCVRLGRGWVVIPDLEELTRRCARVPAR